VTHNNATSAGRRGSPAGGGRTVGDGGAITPGSATSAGVAHAPDASIEIRRPPAHDRDAYARSGRRSTLVTTGRVASSASATSPMPAAKEMAITATDIGAMTRA